MPLIGILAGNYKFSVIYVNPDGSYGVRDVSDQVSSIVSPISEEEDVESYFIDDIDPPTDEPGDFDKIHNPDFYTEQNIEPPWMMFTYLEYPQRKNVRLLVSQSPSPTEDLVKAPLVIDGEWDGETFRFLYPSTSTPPLGNAEIVDGYFLGFPNQKFWAMPKGSDEQYVSEEYPLGDIFFRTTQIAPYMYTEESGGSGVGSGTSFPIGYNISDFMKMIWKVKSLSIDFSVKATHTYTGANNAYSNIGETSFSGDFDLESQTYTGSVPTEKDLAYISRDNLNESSLPSKNTYRYYTDQADEVTEVNSGNLSFRWGNKIKKVGDIYYPEIYIDATPDPFVIDARSFKQDASWTGGAQANFNGKTISMFYIPESTQPSGITKFTMDSFRLDIKPKTYWSYGGRYDVTTGEPLDPDYFAVNPNNSNQDESNPNKNLIAGVFSKISDIVHSLFGFVNLNYNRAIAYLSGQDLSSSRDQLAATAGSQNSFPLAGVLKVTKARITHFGGCEDVRVDSQGYAKERDQKTGEFNRYARTKNGSKIKFPCGRTRGGTGYSETGSVSKSVRENFLREYTPSKDFYAAYPSNTNLPLDAQVGGKTKAGVKTDPYTNEDLLNYCMRVSNPKTGSYVDVDIIDRGPGDADTIDLSKAAINRIGLSYASSTNNKANATLVPKSEEEVGLDVKCTESLI